ncbi:MAG TPA: cupin domain-containing protein [Candidatus Acidoferrales bacterium]|nr:cupin domain-containing protein [Candidatus Acidoferrales bacterium]
MITRRKMNTTLAAAVAAFLSGSTSALAEVTAPLAPGNAQGQAPSASPMALSTLMQEPLGELANPQVSVITITLEPGASSPPHQHTGPVFAYILDGEIENQVDPNPAQNYQAGQYFYEPPMHVHRAFRNLSKTQSAKLLIFEIGEKGKAFTIGAK